MNVRQAFKRNASKIYLVEGIIGFVSATILAVKKADKVKPIIEDTKEELDAVTMDDVRYGFSSKAEERRYKAKVIAKAAIDISAVMAVPIGISCMSIGCLVKSHKEATKPYLEAVGTIGILKNSADLYKKAVSEEVDAETLKKIDERVIARQIVDQISSICKSDDGICEDYETFNRYFSKETSNKFPDGGADTVLPFLKSQETYFNQLLHARERRGRPGIVRFNEVLDALGFSKIPEGETAGWISYGGDGSIDFGIAGAYHTDYDGLLDRYNCVRDPEKIPRSDSGYMLCFNVDPFIVK